MRKGHPPKVRTPQEKKRLSLAKDRRNAYGNSDKAARKAIPMRKALERRKARHRAEQDTLALPQVEETLADALESSIRADTYRTGGWTKGPDIPLANWIAKQTGAAVARAFRRVRRRDLAKDSSDD